MATTLDENLEELSGNGTQKKPVTDDVLAAADQLLGKTPAAAPAAPTLPATIPENATANPKQAELDQALKDFRADMDFNRGTGGWSARDEAMRRDLLSRIETGTALKQQRSGDGMDIDSALAALNAASKTNRLEYATTNRKDTGGMLADVLGLPNRTPTGKSGSGGDPFRLDDVWQNVKAETGKQALSLDQILHPEKYEKPTLFSTDQGVARVPRNGAASIVPGTEKKETPISGKAQSVRDEEGNVIGHYVDGKFVKAGSDNPPVTLAKIEPAELSRYTRRSEEINQRLTEIDRELAAGNKKSGADWWFPKSNNFAQEKQRLENELTGIRAVLSGQNIQPDRTNRTNPAQQPPKEMLSANDAAKAAGQATFSFGGKTYKVR